MQRNHRNRHRLTWLLLFVVIGLGLFYAINFRGDIPVEELILKDLEEVREINERIIQGRRVE